MIALFCGILYIGRSLSQEARLGSAVIGAIAAPMIFEFPFDLIVMTRTYPAVSPDPALYRVLIFAPLFLVEFTTLALLALSPLVRLSQAAFFTFALMLLIFAVWALFGLGYPSAPLPFAFNAVSKIAAFAVALSLFLPQRGQASTPEPASAGRFLLLSYGLWSRRTPRCACARVWLARARRSPWGHFGTPGCPINPCLPSLSACRNGPKTGAGSSRKAVDGTKGGVFAIHDIGRATRPPRDWALPIAAVGSCSCTSSQSTRAPADPAMPRGGLPTKFDMMGADPASHGGLAGPRRTGLRRGARFVG